jgi:hypothetical protein
MSLDRQYSFFGRQSALGALTCAGILVIGSARLCWAITIAGGLLWVYGLTSFTFAFLLSTIGDKIMPVRGRSALYVCLASFWGSLYLLLFWLLCPLAALETFFILLLIPLYYAVSGIADQMPSSVNNSNIDIFELASDSVSQAGVISGLLIAFSILREPLSYCSLTFPGSSQGMITIMYFKANSFFPIGIFASASGALLLLAYIVCLYQYSKSVIYPGERI